MPQSTTVEGLNLATTVDDGSNPKLYHFLVKPTIPTGIFDESQQKMLIEIGRLQTKLDLAELELSECKKSSKTLHQVSDGGILGDIIAFIYNHPIEAVIITFVVTFVVTLFLSFLDQRLASHYAKKYNIKQKAILKVMFPTIICFVQVLLRKRNRKSRLADILSQMKNSISSQSLPRTSANSHSHLPQSRSTRSLSRSQLSHSRPSHVSLNVPFPSNKSNIHESETDSVFEHPFESNNNLSFPMKSTRPNSKPNNPTPALNNTDVPIPKPRKNSSVVISIQTKSI